MICTKPNITYDHAKIVVMKQIYTINASILSKNANQTTFHVVRMQENYAILTNMCDRHRKVNEV